jgi:hypothetical protein
LPGPSPQARRPHDPTGLAAALRACAAGLYPLEAGVGLLIAHGTFLHRIIHHGTAGTAAVDWDAAISALDSGRLPASGGEQRIVRIADSLTAGHPVSLRDAVPGLDQHGLHLAVTAIRRAAGQRQ